MEAEGLVVRVPHAGYRIPPQITRHRFEDMLEVRLLLEPAAARRSAERASAEQVAGLRRMLEEMAELEGRWAHGLRRLRATRRRFSRSRRPERGEPGHP
ncbi:FCD domain-containing protein [Micromonospora sp. M12]